MSSSDGGEADRFPFQAQTLSASLTVGDLASSLAWYRDVIGFEVDQRHERDGELRAVSLRAGAVGGALESEPMDMPWGARVFRVLDPDGFKLAISSVPEPPSGS